MDWSNVLSALIGGFSALAWCEFRTFLALRFKWKCPEEGCHFVFTSNNQQVTEYMQADHWANHAKERRTS